MNGLMTPMFYLLFIKALQHIVHTFHYHCPCGHCLAVSMPLIYTELT